MKKQSERLEELMRELDIKATDICKATGIAKSSMSMYMSGERQMRQDKIAVIAETYNVDPAWLMGYDVPMNWEVHKFKTSTVPIINSSIDAKQRFGAKMTTKEIRIVEAYRKADNCIQSVVAKLLDVVDEPVLLAAHADDATLDQIKEDADMI